MKAFTLLLSSLAVLWLGSVASAQTPYGIATPRAVPAPFFDGKFPSSAPAPGSPTGWTVVPVFPNLTFSNPMGIAQMPGSNLMVVWEREGAVRLFEKDSATASSTLMLDLTNRTQGWDDCGLMKVVFHPQFSLADPTHRHIYVYYVHTTPGSIRGSAQARPPLYTPAANRLSRFEVGADGIAIASSEQVLFHQSTNTTWHHGGDMFFHPSNGFLYVIIGEDVDPAAAQRLDGRLLGGIIRIDVDQRGGSISHAIPRQPLNGSTAHYFIPNDNPLVGRPNTLEEYFAIGLRSPHRMTLDAVSGRIYSSDTGGDLEEEINLIEPTDPAPLNFQWPQIEGAAKDMTGSYVGTSRRPLIHYGRAAGDGSAVIGGYVYRGSEHATAPFAGKYVFADNISGRVWWVDESVYPPAKRLITTVANGPGLNTGDNYAGISSFGLDADGELYLVRLSTTGGGIFKLAQAPLTSTNVMPKLLSQTGLFTSLTTLAPSPKLIPYTVNAPFWSDGAEKQRWAAVPSAVTFAATGEWSFPAGSVFVKHFDLPSSDVAPSNPLLKKRLETRVLVRTSTGVYGASYKWRADGKEAELVSDTVFENLPIAISNPGRLAATNLGSAALSGISTQSGTVISCLAAGTGLSSTADQGRYLHHQRTGDFDFSVRVAALTAQLPTRPTPNARLSLVIREALTTGSRCIALSTSPAATAKQSVPTSFAVQARDSTGGVLQSFAVPEGVSAAYPNVWLRIARVGDLFITYLSGDGAEWTETGRVTMALPAQVYCGVFLASGNASGRAKATVHLQTKRLQRWSFPGPQSCLACHTQASGGVLGLNTRQLNGNLLYPATSVTDNQLRAWGHAGLFSNPPAEADIPTSFTALVPLSQTTASLEDRARSYFDSNCSQCHRPGGVPTLWDARADTPLVSQGIVNGSLVSQLGLPAARVIKPADVPNSMIHLRTDLVGPHQMPPLGRNRVDAEAVKLLEQWIGSLSP